jgi:hypothetical protein
MDIETITIGLILLLPVFLSLFLYLLVRVFMRRSLKSDLGADPPSYLISQQDPLLLEDGKPPAYSPQRPPAYSTTITIESEEIPLNIVLQTVLDQRQRRQEKENSITVE